MDFVVDEVGLYIDSVFVLTAVINVSQRGGCVGGGGV